MTAIPASTPAAQIVANDAKNFGRLLWRWLVVYPVTRALFFIVVTVAGSLLAAAVAILGVILSGLVVGSFALLVLAVLIVVVILAPAPIMVTPTQWGQFIDKFSGKKGAE